VHSPSVLVSCKQAPSAPRFSSSSSGLLSLVLYPPGMFDYPLPPQLEAYARGIPEIAILPQDNIIMVPSKDETRRVLGCRLDSVVEKMFQGRMALSPGMKPAQSSLI